MENLRNKQETLQEIRRNAIEVDNYNFLDAYVREKQIVLLGESNHGIGDYFSEKIKMIKYLHEHHGFNIVVFENGLVESTISKERSSFEEPELVLQNTLWTFIIMKKCFHCLKTRGHKI